MAAANLPLIATTIASLLRGFLSGDRSAIDELLGYWSTHVARLATEPIARDQVVSTESVVGAKLHRFDVCPTLFLGEKNSEIRQALEDFVRETASELTCGLIVCLTDSAHLFATHTTLLPKYRAVILSRDDFVAVLQDRQKLFQLIRQQIPLRRLIPFSVSEPTCGAMFVGRHSELRSLIDENQDFALCGPGGIGKSSLLHQMQWTLRRERSLRHTRIVVVDLHASTNPCEAAAEVAQRVHPSRRSFADVHLGNLDVFLRHVRNTDIRFKEGPIDLVIDEADEVLEADSHNNYLLMKALRTARHHGLIRLTLSGRTRTKALLESTANPFSIDSVISGKPVSRLKLLEITPMTDEEARQLLIEPLTQLDCMDPMKEADRILELRRCQGIPFYIQRMGFDLADEVAKSLERRKA